MNPNVWDLSNLCRLSQPDLEYLWQIHYGTPTITLRLTSDRQNGTVIAMYTRGG